MSVRGGVDSSAVAEFGPIVVRDLRPEEVPKAVGVLARFEVIGEGPVLGVPNWFMLREPRSDAGS
jgi:hypothetical protein